VTKFPIPGVDGAEEQGNEMKGESIAATRQQDVEGEGTEEAVTK